MKKIKKVNRNVRNIKQKEIRVENKVSKIILGILIIGSKGIFANQVQELDKKSFYTTEKKEQQKNEEIEKPHVKKEEPCLEPYGIKLSQTKIEEMKQRFKLLYKKEGELGDIYIFDSQDFNLGNFKAKEVAVYTLNGLSEYTVENIEITLSGKHFRDLKEKLSEKYYISSIEEHFVGDNICILKSKEVKNQFIALQELHMSFDTTLIYRTAKFEEARSAKINEKISKQNADMESKL